MEKAGKKRQQRGIVRSLLIFVLTMIILFVLFSKNQDTYRPITNLAILNLIARVVIMCILFNYSDTFLKIGAFLFAYAKIFGIVSVIFSNTGIFEIEMILEIIGIVMIVATLFLLSKNVLGDQLFKLAFSDSLTGLMNRHAFLSQTRRVLKILSERNKTAAVIYIDLNRFKSVNDHHGHHIGDQVLETIGRRIKSMVRKGDLVARLGGDEFVFFLSDSNEKIAEEVVKRIIDKISCPIVIDGVQFCLGVSAGIAIFPKDGKTVDELIKSADKAMYRAKNMENNYMFSSEIQQI